jgi:AhpD family alkylhydroperoxidase
MAKLTEYKDMDPRAKAVVERVAEARGIDSANVNNVWKALAFAPSKLDPLTKELVYAAVSIANQCDYCIASHGTMTRAKGMTEEMHADFMAVVLAAQKGKKIAMTCRVPVDRAFEET